MSSETAPFDTLVTNRSKNESISDTPISYPGDDKLKFGKMAEYLAGTFKKNDLSGGLVIGVEGAWGSGKSSLVNLALNKLQPEQVIRFSPWLVGNHKDLIYQFFLDLDNATYDLLPKNIQKKTRKMVMKYAQIAVGIAQVFEPLECSMLGKLIKILLRQSAQWTSESSLGRLRLQLRKSLSELKNPIIIFLDDLDRLEPRETVEVLRLVRAVADFPNVGYILAYDPEILTMSLKNAINVDEKHAFLEKIVQASFRVPNAQRRVLKNWLNSEYMKLLKVRSLDEREEMRILQVLDNWGDRYLETPRDVVRTINSLKLNFVPVREQVDPSDALFLQLVQVKDKLLFDWIQRYTELLSSFWKENVIPEDAIINMGDELLNISRETKSQGQAKFIKNLEEHLPGLSFSQTKNGGEFSVFSNLENLDVYYQDFRLASPQYFSLYFAFTHIDQSA